MDIEQYIAKYEKNTTNLNTKTVQDFMEKLGHPERELKVIHIAGTNGKGSVTEMMTNILMKAGYKVGKFISPHLVKYNERISVNHKNITDIELEEYIKKIETVGTVSFFEMTTIMAILYFKEQNCDFVVLETGLGGMYDATNIVNPMVSIITSIGKDHMQILGNTIEEIAVQKAGIIKQKGDTVFPLQEESVNTIIENTCKQKNNELHTVESKNISSIEMRQDLQSFDYKDKKQIEVNLKGEKQILNACICIETIEILRKKRYSISEEALREGLKKVVHKARFETLSKNPLIVFDGAHNEPAMQNFVQTVKQYNTEKQKTYVVSILKRKDYQKMLEILLQNKEAEYIFTSGNDSQRFIEKEELEKIAKQIIPKGNIKTMELEEAIEQIKQRKTTTFFVGSFYTYELVSKEIAT